MSDAPPPYFAASNEKGAPCQPAPGYPPPPGFVASQAGYPPQPGYQSQPAGYPPAGAPPGGPHNTVIVSQPAMTVVQVFRETPVHTICPHCQADIVTATTFDAGTFSWLICIIICLLGCPLGCCLIPFCVDSCQDVIHTCPNCHQQISRWGRM